MPASKSLYEIGLVSYYPWATGLLMEALLKDGTDKARQEAEAAIERLAAEPVLEGSAFRDLILLRSRALLARARGDEVSYRDFAHRYRDMATSLGFEGHMAIAEALVGTDDIEPPTADV